jgi:hypothetical protein
MEIFYLGLKLTLCIIAMKSKLGIGEIGYEDINWIKLVRFCAMSLKVLIFFIRV